MVFGSPPVTPLLIVTGRLQYTDVYQSTLQRDSRAQPGTEVGSPSMDTVLATLACSEHPGDSPVSWRQTKFGFEVTARGKEGEL